MTTNEVEDYTIDVARSDAQRVERENAPQPVANATPHEPARSNRISNSNPKRVPIKDSPAKCSGRNEDYVAWSEQLLSYATHWALSTGIFKEQGIDVSDPRKSDADSLREGVELDTLYEYRNAWYSLLRSAGSTPVQRMIITSKDVGTAWSCVRERFCPHSTAQVQHLQNVIQTTRIGPPENPCSLLALYEDYGVRLAAHGESIGPQVTAFELPEGITSGI